MRIIGMIGYPGCGKTEMIGLLKRQNNRIYVCRFDELRDSAAQKSKNKTALKKLLGNRIFKKVGGLEVFDVNYLYTCTPDQILKCQKLLMPDMEKEFFNLTAKLKDDYEIFIAEYFMLPLSSRIWSQCVKVFIDAGEEQRHRRLENRIDSPCLPEEAKKRDKLTRMAWRESIENSEDMTDDQIEEKIRNQCIRVANTGTREQFKENIFAFLENVLKLVLPWTVYGRGSARKKCADVKNGSIEDVGEKDCANCKKLVLS